MVLRFVQEILWGQFTHRQFLDLLQGISLDPVLLMHLLVMHKILTLARITEPSYSSSSMEFGQSFIDQN